MNDGRRRFRSIIDDLPLRSAIAFALIFGLTVPVAVSAWQQVRSLQETLTRDLDQDHRRIVETLSIGMQAPIWEVRPDIGRPMIDTLMRDQRVTSITVTAPMLPDFLTATAAERRQGTLHNRTAAVVRNGEVIGSVHVEMTAAPVEAEIRRQWRTILLTGAIQLALGLFLIFMLLRLKVLAPIRELLGQSKLLAAGRVDRPFPWLRADELGALGRSFEQTRQALSGLIQDLERRNEDLRAREASLDEQARTLRATLENTSDGITLVDRDLNLVAWNSRFREIFEFPGELLRSGLPIGELHRFDVGRGRYPPHEAATFVERMRSGFRTNAPSSTEIEMIDGKIISIRRQPLPDGGFVTTYAEVTDQVRSQRRADEARKLLEAVMDAVPAFIHVKDRDLCYRMANRRFLDLWGFTAETMAGRRMEDLFGPDVVKTFAERDAEVLATGQPLPLFEWTIEPPRQPPIDVLTTKVPLLDASGAITHIVTVHLDITKRKRAERALRESEELYRLLVDLSPYGVMLHDPHRIVFLNAAGCGMLGLDGVADAVGRHYLDFVIDREKAEVGERIRQIFVTGQPLSQAERRLMTLDGRIIDVGISAVPFERGGRRLALVMFRDVTERKRIELERQRWLQLFQDAIESVPNGFVVFDKDRKLVLCNSAFARIYGHSARDMEGTLMADLLPRFLSQAETVEDLPVAEAANALGIAGETYWFQAGEPIQVGLRDGRWMLVSRHPTAEGGLVCVRTDISELKRMQQALADSEELHRLLVDLSPCGILLHDEEKIVFINPEGCRIFGETDPRTVIGRRYVDFVAPSDREKAAWRLQRTLDGQPALEQAERRFVGRDGRTTIAAVAGLPFMRGGEHLALVMFLDITPIKTAEAEIARQQEVLHQSEKMSALGALLAGVAHELNNPLSVVVGRAIMLEEATLDPASASSITKIRVAAERCARIVRTFLAMARRQEPQRTAVRIDTLIETSLELLGYGLTSAGIRVVKTLPKDLPQTCADPDQLTQVFNNLIINAKQAMAETSGRRELTISAAVDPKEGRILVSFVDTGPGIAADVRPRIFDPYFTTKPAGGGTGIGLAVCRGIVEAHGGEIRLDDSPPGLGATFTLVLPIADGSVQADDTAEPAAPERNGPSRILVVDDEKDVSETLKDILTADGHEVEVSDDGRVALDRLDQCEFDLVISDLIMPGLDGQGLYRELCRRQPATAGRIVFITGDTLSPGAKRFLSESERPVIEKPFVPEDIRRLVREKTALRAR
jgi:PAS domain S-box-containing protein